MTDSTDPASRQEARGDLAGSGKRPAWRWTEGDVDPVAEHLELGCDSSPGDGGDACTPVALVGKPRGRVFRVQWLIDRADPAKAAVVEAARRALDFVLLEIGGPQPWKYACYHCGTTANIYSNVHWSWFPKGCKKADGTPDGEAIERSREQYYGKG